MKGSIGTEIVLWLLFLLPGIIYSVWRFTTVTYGCPKCGAPNMIPLDSPVAKKMLPENYAEPGRKPMSPAKAWAIAIAFIGIIVLIFLTSR